VLWTFKEGWLKNDDSEALLVINQTLGNQQAVIDSLQASLASQDTQLDSTMIADMIAAAGGLVAGGGTKYLALLQFNSAEYITSVTMVDPTLNGTYTTSGVTTTTSIGGNGQKFAEIQFANEGYAPSSVVAYAVDMKNDEYKITALNTAGDNLAHEITGATMSLISGLDYSSNLFSSFSSYTFKVDCTSNNLDYVRDNIPPQFKEAHVYIVFQF